jgi:hypothetical protein
MVYHELVVTLEFSDMKSSPLTSVSALAVAAFVSLAFGGTAVAHAVPTHHNITRAAVDYLRSQVEEFGCFNDSQLQIGTGDEDSGDRPVFHFYPALTFTNSSADSPTWGLSAAPFTATWGPFGARSVTNTHTYPAAKTNAKDPDTGEPSDLGWVDLGFVLHLLEDLTSPAHTRNDPHPPGDGDPVEAQTRVPVAPSGGLLTFSSPRAAFDSLRNWTRSNFFSKDTCFDPAQPGPVATTTEPANDTDYFHDTAGNRIAYKGLAWWLSGVTDAGRDRRQCTIDSVIAGEQWTRLGPQAVLYAASFIKYYYDDAGPLINALQNGGFEYGDLTGWTIAPSSPGYVAVSLDQTSEGSYAGRLGRWDQPYSNFGGFNGPSVPGVEPLGTDSMYQDFQLPPDGTARLTFDFNVETYDGAAYDWLDVFILDATTGATLAQPVTRVGGIIRGSTSNWGEYYTTGWRTITANLTPYIGRRIRVQFSVRQDGYGDQIAAYIDKVELKCEPN